MSGNISVFIREIGEDDLGHSVLVTGIIIKKWTLPHDGGFGILLYDLTNQIRVSFRNNNRFDKNLFIKDKRVRLKGIVAQDSKSNLFLSEVTEVEFLEEINVLQKDLDRKEQISLVLQSDIINIICNLLAQEFHCLQVSTRIISRKLGGDIVEPLRVHYPGFGSAAYLTPSPSSQLTEFLTVTLLPRVFTSTSSFTSSHRFRNGSTEMPIIMAKIINLPEAEESRIIEDITDSIVKQCIDKSKTISIIDEVKEWDIGDEKVIKREENCFVRWSYKANIPVIGKNWNSVVYKICQLEDDKGNLLLESSRERVIKGIDIYTITFYPTQFLNWVSNGPKRQIPNLYKIYTGGNMYG